MPDVTVSFGQNEERLVFIANGRAHFLDGDNWTPSMLGPRDRALLEAFLTLAKQKLADNG